MIVNYRSNTGTGTIFKGKTEFVIYAIHSQDLGDEFHYLLKCIFMSDIRKNCISNNFFRNANILKFGELMNQTKLSKLKTVCIY